jgi:hypothetical protein
VWKVTCATTGVCAQGLRIILSTSNTCDYWLYHPPLRTRLVFRDVRAPRNHPAESEMQGLHNAFYWVRQCHFLHTRCGVPPPSPSPVVRHQNSGLGLLIEVSGSHTTTHTHTHTHIFGRISLNEWSAIHSECYLRTMPLARLKLAIERLQTYAVYRTAILSFHKLGCTISYTSYLTISPHASDTRASFWARSKRKVAEVWQLALPRLFTCKPNTSVIKQFAWTFTEAEACCGNEDQN